MSEPKLISPMLDNFDMGSSISEHHGVSCYPAMSRDSDERYIVKTISIPASQRQLDALLLSGAYPDEVSALEYFKDVADNTVDEIEVMNRLSQIEGFLPFESYQVATLEDRIGYIVYLLSVYRRTLKKHFRKEPMTHLGAVNLGLDICAALAVCRKSGYLYVDLKPSNIYIVNDKEYRIGDLGFIRLDSLKYASLPDKYRSQYTAPEITDAFAALNSTIDIYAAGLILYQAYNGGELPFDGDCAPTEVLPPPEYADYEMAEIILKACAPNPEDRWQDPIEMGQAIVSYMQRNGANDTPIIPPIIPVTLTEPLSEEEMDLSAFGISDEEMDDIDVDIDELLSEDEPVAEEVAEISEAIAQEVDELPAEAEDAAEPALEEIAEILETTAEETEYAEDDFGNLSFLNDLINDETSPENTLTDVDYGEVSDELSAILSQADELVAHQVPDPVIAPEAIDVAIPEPALDEEMPEEPTVVADEAKPEEIVEEPEPIAESEPKVTLILSEVADAEEPTEEDQKETVSDEDDAVKQIAAAIAEASDEEPLITSSDTQIVNDLQNDDDGDEEAEEEPAPAPAPKKKAKWLPAVLIVLIVAIIAAAGYLYYRYFYLLPINTIKIDGDENSMVVYVDSDIDESLLSVVCSDSHGHQISAAVVDGQATFANLAPDTAYNVTVLVDGFHRLVGDIEASYSTPAQTNIVQFSAVTGPEDGSVILAFTVDGPDSGQWSISYSADGEAEKTEPLVSHMIQLSGLTIGKEYTFKLMADDSMYVVGTNEIKFTASELVYAQDLNILSCADGKLTAAWVAPVDVEVANWTVRCYSANGYDQTIITSETSAVFEELDSTASYTVDVTAAGMSVSQRAYVAEKAITITDFHVDTTNSNRITLTWNSSLDVPEGGWILLYSVDGSEEQGTVTTSTNSAVISPMVPDATYNFTLQDANGSDVLSLPLTCQTPKAADFSGYGITPSSISMKMCKTPDLATWTYEDLEESDYTTRFAVGESISFQAQLLQSYSESEDSITVLYVIRDSEGKIVNYSSAVETWENMWYKYYGEFDLPREPVVAGSYTVSIYFNGLFVAQQEFSIV